MTREQFEDIERPAPAGWFLREPQRTFSGYSGPFYYRKTPEPGVGFYSEPRHQNLAGVVHGGMLLTLADMSLFDACLRADPKFRGVTVTMNSEFLAGAPIGAFIAASSQILRMGRSLVFLRGLAMAEDKELLAFSGTLKRLPASSPPSGSPATRQG